MRRNCAGCVGRTWTFQQGRAECRQRADRWGKIGKPKSYSGERTVPLLPMVVNALREWKLACPKGDLDLAFPNRNGHVEQLATIVRLGWHPAQIAAGVIGKHGARNIPACTRFGISMRRGASTAAPTADWSCR